MIKKPRPIPLAMLIFDTLIEDRMTGKKSLIGMFNNINSAVAPCIHPQISVFLVMTEGIGDYEGVLRCVNDEEAKPIMEMKGPVAFKDPNQIVEINFELRNVRFPRYGEYRFEFSCGGELLISRKFAVSPVPHKPSQRPEPPGE